jgi:hypothetical protein
MNPEPSDENLKPDLTAKGIWQRLPHESANAYAAFTTYLELGPDATLPQVAEKVGRTLEAIRHLSSRYNWLERAASWRQHFAIISMAAVERAAEKQAQLWSLRQELFQELQWEATQQLLTLSRQLRNKSLANADKEVALYELVRLHEVISRIARLTFTRAANGGPAAEPAPSVIPAIEESIKKLYGESFSPEKYTDLLKLVNGEPSPPPYTAALPKPPPAPTPSPDPPPALDAGSAGIPPAVTFSVPPPGPTTPHAGSAGIPAGVDSPPPLNGQPSSDQAAVTADQSPITNQPSPVSSQASPAPVSTPKTQSAPEPSSATPDKRLGHTRKPLDPHSNPKPAPLKPIPP